MRRLILFCALPLLAFAAETEVTVDTAQPRAVLTQLTSDQGGYLDVRLLVRENGRVCRSITNDTFTFQFTTNRTAGVYQVCTNTSKNLLAGSVLCVAGPFVTAGVYDYEVFYTRSGRPYPLGRGQLLVEETTGLGAIVEADFSRPLNTDIINQTGTNQFVRADAITNLSSRLVSASNAISEAISPIVTNVIIGATWSNGAWWGRAILPRN